MPSSVVKTLSGVRSGLARFATDVLQDAHRRHPACPQSLHGIRHVPVESGHPLRQLHAAHQTLDSWHTSSPRGSPQRCSTRSQWRSGSVAARRSPSPPAAASSLSTSPSSSRGRRNQVPGIDEGRVGLGAQRARQPERAGGQDPLRGRPRFRSRSAPPSWPSIGRWRGRSSRVTGSSCPMTRITPSSRSDRLPDEERPTVN